MFSYSLSKLSLNTIFGKYSLIFRFYFVINGKQFLIIFIGSIIIAFHIYSWPSPKLSIKWSFSPSPFLWSYLLAQLLVPSSGADIHRFHLAPVVGVEKDKLQEWNTLVSTASQPHAQMVWPVNPSLQTPILGQATGATAVQGALEGWQKTMLLLRWN